MVDKIDNASEIVVERGESEMRNVDAKCRTVARGEMARLVD
jgi:hypothetical protein